MTLNELYLLIQLSKKDNYGLELCSNIRKTGAKMLVGSVYNTLDRMEKSKLVTSYWGEDSNDTGGARRKYYYLNQRGKQVLKKTLESIGKMTGK